MKVVFVHLGREHLGIESLSAVLREKGHETALACDPGLFGENDNTLHLPRLASWLDRRRRVLETVAREKPALVAVTAYTGTYRWARGIAAEAKRISGAFVVLGGVHPSLVPERVLADGEADAVVVGEGEGAILDIAAALEAGQWRTDIPNTWSRRDGEIARNSPRPPLDVDSLPFPDKTLFEDQVAYRDDYLVMTSRGCPYSCSYCCEGEANRLYGHRFFRRRRVDHVMEELCRAKRRYGFREVMFFDSVLFTDKAWLADLLGRYRAEIGVPFRCEGHVNFLDREIARLLVEAGCYCVDFGLQSASERIRREVLNRPESDEQVARALSICDEAGLRYDVDLIFDLPGERVEDLEAAARLFARARRLNRVKTYNLTYFPHTPIVETARRAGCLTDAAVARIERGEMPGDFFHGDSLAPGADRRAKRGFRLLFKALPILPPAWVEGIVRRRGYLWLARLPGPVSLVLEVLVAIRNRDRRYAIHARRYARAALARLVGRA